MIQLTQEQQEQMAKLAAVIADPKSTRQETFIAGCEATFSLLPNGNEVAQTFWSRIKGGLQNVQDPPTTNPTASLHPTSSVGIGSSH